VAFWNRRRAPGRRASLTVNEGVVAAVQRYDLDNPSHVEALVKQQHQWQSDAWFYADAVGELKDAVRFVENCFRRITLTVGFLREPDDEPVAIMDARAPRDGGPDRPTDAPAPEADDFVPDDLAQAAEDTVIGFAARDGGQAALMGKLGVNIFLVGEAVIVNRRVMARRPAREERPEQVEQVWDWEVRSKDEVRRSQTGGREVVELVDAPDQREGVKLDGDAFVERVWRRHARWSSWADSNVRAAVGTLEELHLLSRLARGSIRSRLLAGVLVLADELDFGDADQPADGSATGKSGKFDRDVAEALAAVIENEADANGAIPLAFRGPKDLIGPDHFRVVEFPRRYQKEDREQYDAALSRLGRTVELPMERLIGLSDVNHWTAWQIDEDTYEAYIEPLVGTVTEALTFGLLRPMLLEDGFDEELVSRCVVMGDASQLIRRPDRGKVATEGYGLETPTLAAEAWRRANGFGDDDAPNDEELLRRLVFAGKLDASITARLLAVWGMLPPELVAEMEAQRQAMIDALGGDGEDDEDDEPEAGGGPSGGDAGPPGGGPPEDGSGGRPPMAVAAAAGALDQDVIVADMLGTADRVLAERLLVAADAAMARALDRAGSRLRSQALAKPDRFGFRGTTAAAARQAVNEALDGVPPMAVAAALGPAAVAAVEADEELWGDAFTELERQWVPWLSATQDFARSALAGYGASDELLEAMAAEQVEHRDEAWAFLLAALLGEARALAARGGGPDAPEDGEFDPTTLVAPGTIREALARAGGARVVLVERFGGLLSADGTPVGGVATGDLVRRYFAAAGVPWTGYRWEYGDASLRQRPYEPHRALGGIVFTRWDDGTLANATGAWPGVTSYYPGDHRHCRCSFTPVLQRPEV
jgi:hypothetical protein